MGIVRVSIFQKALQDGLNLTIFKKLAALKSDFLIFPEYFFADGAVRDAQTAVEKSQYALDWLLKLNDSYKGIIIGGSLALQEDGKVYTAAPVISEGQVVDWYRKRDISGAEAGFAEPGSEPGIFILGGYRFAVLIDSDITRPEYFQELADMGIKTIFIVGNSPHAENGARSRMEDDELLCKPARDFGMYLSFCGSTGQAMGQDLVGRSMVVTPLGISWRVASQEADREILKTIMLNITE